jgi:hypothetical protein
MIFTLTLKPGLTKFSDIPVSLSQNSSNLKISIIQCIVLKKEKGTFLAKLFCDGLEHQFVDQSFLPLLSLLSVRSIGDCAHDTRALPLIKQPLREISFELVSEKPIEILVRFEINHA